MKDKYKEQYRELGERIAFYRKRRGMTQEELALKVNCSTEYIEQIENYDVKSDFSWSVNMLLTISDALEVDVLIFLGCL